MRKTFAALLLCLPLLLLSACGIGGDLPSGEVSMESQSFTQSETSSFPSASEGTTSATAAISAMESTSEATSASTTEPAPAFVSPYGRLPAIYLTTDNGKSITSRTEYTSGTFALRIGEKTLYDTSLSVGKMPMQIRGRGHSSWDWPKKPYRIKLDARTSLFGLPEAKNWILRPSYCDKSLIRDHVASVMGNTLRNLEFVPKTVLVDVWFNNSYQGVYVFSERIEVYKGRLELDEGLGAYALT